MQQNAADTGISHFPALVQLAELRERVILITVVVQAVGNFRSDIADMGNAALIPG